MNGKTVSLRRFEPARCPTCGRPQPRDPLPPKGADAAIDAYRALRATAARKEGVPPWRVFPNRTLRALADLRPVRAEELALVHGLGPDRRKRYGRALLATGRKLRRSTNPPEA